VIRVLVCDDQEMAREGLTAILRGVPDIELVGVAAGGREALDLVGELGPDVVLMDLKMPGMTGAEATRQINALFPGTRVLVLTTYDADEWIFDAIRAGAAGYLLKDSSREQLIAAIHSTAAGRTPVDHAVAGRLFAHIAQRMPVPSAVGADLNDSERAVLRLLAGGLSNAAIADRLHFSPGTVRNYVSAILAKLGVSDRTQAAVLALRHGLADEKP
jgi:NarL family two-component system response regulator LiaR